MTDDDPSIANSTRLYRRVHPKQVVWDDNESRLRPTSAAFNDEELSVNLGDDLSREGLSPDFALRNTPEHHLTWLTGAFVRTEAQAIYRDHLPDDPTHGIVEGPKPGARRTRFAKRAEWETLRSESLKDEHRERLDNASGG